MDPVSLINSIADLAKSTGQSVNQAEIDQAKQTLKDSTMEVELWAGKSDLLLRQVKAHFNLNMKNIPDQPGATALIDFLLTDTASKVNQPIPIRDR
jgi:hypothetical protein